MAGHSSEKNLYNSKEWKYCWLHKLGDMYTTMRKFYVFPSDLAVNKYRRPYSHFHNEPIAIFDDEKLETTLEDVKWQPASGDDDRLLL